MNVALVGLGYWGAKLMRNLVTLVGAANVIAIDADNSRLDDAKERFVGIRTHPSLTSALKAEPVDAVLLATPPETHAVLGHMALNAGCHLFVEKPMARSVHEAQSLVQSATSQGVVLMVGHTFLYSPRVQWIADHLRTGSLGTVHYVTSSRLNLGIHRHDANVIWDLAPHDFSIVCSLLGEFPTTVQATARCIVRTALPDVAFVTMTFPSGIVAAVDMSWLAPKKIRNTVIVADSGMIVYDDNEPDEPVKLYDRGVVVPDSPDFADNQLTYRYGATIAPHIAATEPLMLELREFIDAIQDHSVRVRSDGHFGLRIVQMLDAADQSWQSGGHPVALPKMASTLTS